MTIMVYANNFRLFTVEFRLALGVRSLSVMSKTCDEYLSNVIYDEDVPQSKYIKLCRLTFTRVSYLSCCFDSVGLCRKDVVPLK